MMTKLELIGITSGEPAGIGPEICLDLAFCSYNNQQVLIIIGDINLLKARASLVNKPVKLLAVSDEMLTDLPPAAHGSLYVYDIACPHPDCLGQPDPTNAAYVLNILDTAIDWCKRGLSKIIVTAPLNKDVINQASIPFSGHTEYLAAKFAIPKVVMMLANPQVRVALLTTHLPLKDVPAQVTAANMNQTLQIIHAAFKTHLACPTPKIAVCGLNPHAGENGYLGTEERDIINPVIAAWQQQGYQVTGSYPADTIFNRADEFDVILAMYHDQGLPVVKYSDFAHGINITLGLPIIRTSVDHGTALDIAGSGSASSSSLLAALAFACGDR
jgi:4-hydroxythreonine-4-phosphate dehydrogenase